MTQYTSVQLFGGAITASLPSTFADVSDIRQVPDNQEVYLDKDGFTSIVVEILERVEKPDMEALMFHFHDLVDEDAAKTKVWTTGEAHLSKLPAGTPAYTLLATSPGKPERQGRRNEPEFFGIVMTLIRLEQQKTDIIVNINVPHIPGQYEPAEVDPEKGKHGPLLEKAIEHRNEVLKTLEIQDWNLFVQE